MDNRPTIIFDVTVTLTIIGFFYAAYLESLFAMEIVLAAWGILFLIKIVMVEIEIRSEARKGKEIWSGKF